jgi:hypothetical protein
MSCEKPSKICTLAFTLLAAVCGWPHRYPSVTVLFEWRSWGSSDGSNDSGKDFSFSHANLDARWFPAKAIIFLDDVIACGLSHETGVPESYFATDPQWKCMFLLLRTRRNESRSSDSGTGNSLRK